MTKTTKIHRPKARLPKGMRDTGAGEIRGLRQMLETIGAVYERYGFEPLETPAFEYTDALGKFLPDADRPNEGVFSFQDEDEQWLSLRYDLTAPLARYVAENLNDLPKPFRRYQTGSVWRNEKPGPGRFRQFTQFDADTVGSASIAADAELCMLAADTLEALGIARGDYVIRVNNRKVLDGVMESIGVTDEGQKLTVLRAIDKLDRLGLKGVAQLLGEGRKDESGDFTKGAGLDEAQIANILVMFKISAMATHSLQKALAQLDDDARLSVYEQEDAQVDGILNGIHRLVHKSSRGIEGEAELRAIWDLVRANGYNESRIRIDPSVVRGLEYYTGPVFEAELTFETTDDKGRPVRFGSVGGGGRYDDLIARFTGQKIPATGFSMGVSRLYAALDHLGKIESKHSDGPVVVTVFDKGQIADYQAMVTELRNADIRAEMYLGNPKNMGAQFKYADQRNAPCVVIQGSDEKERGEVQIKDLVLGRELSADIADNAEWRESRPAQIAVKRSELVAAVGEIIARQRE